MNFYEDLEVGQRREVGSYTFTAEAIKAFAAKYDPQRFHLDEEEGRKSLFGGLAASGWHVGSACMKMMVADGQRRMREARRARREGRHLWARRRAFATCAGSARCSPATPSAFRPDIESKRVSESRPGWGILQAATRGVNQRGEEVYSIKATAFVPMRDAVN